MSLVHWKHIFDIYSINWNKDTFIVKSPSWTSRYNELCDKLTFQINSKLKARTKWGQLIENVLSKTSEQ